MSYLSTIQLLRTAAETVNSTGRNLHGRHVDVTEKAEGDYPLIFIYPVTMRDPDSPDFLDNSRIIVGFWDQDAPGNSIEQREDIISAMDDLCTQFMTLIGQNKFVRITGANREAQYLMYGSTLSGMAVSFNLTNFTPCE